MMVLWGCDLVICLEIDIYFVTGFLPQGEALQYPLPYEGVDLEIFSSGHFGRVPLTERCIAIATVIDLAKRCALAAIV